MSLIVPTIEELAVELAPSDSAKDVIWGAFAPDRSIVEPAEAYGD